MVKIIPTVVSYVNIHFPHFKSEEYSDDFLKCCLVYRYLYGKYFLKNIEINKIIYRLNNGLINLLFQTNSNVLKNHLVFSYAFSEFYDYYKKGRSEIYVTNSFLQNSSLIGFLMVIVCWFFNKGVC